MANIEFAAGLLTAIVAGYAVISLLLKDVVPRLEDKLDEQLAKDTVSGLYLSITIGVTCLTIGGLLLLTGIVRPLPMDNPDLLSTLGVPTVWVIYGGTSLISIGVLVPSMGLAHSSFRLYRKSK